MASPGGKSFSDSDFRAAKHFALGLEKIREDIERLVLIDLKKSLVWETAQSANIIARKISDYVMTRAIQDKQMNACIIVVDGTFCDNLDGRCKIECKTTECNKHLIENGRLKVKIHDT